MLENHNPTDKNILSLVNKIFIYLILVYLPVSELFIHALESYTSLPNSAIFWLSHFYEPVLAVLILSNLLFVIIKKKLSYSAIDILALAFLVWSVISVLVHPDALQRGFESLRFVALPFAFYIFVRLSNYANPKKIAMFYLAITGVISTIGVVEYFFLPANWLANFFGISNFGFGQNALVSTNQASSFLAGPNQLASYLIFPFFYELHRAVIAKKFFQAWTNYLLLPIGLALVLTFSRSAILGTFVAVILFMIFLPKEARPKISGLILFFVTALTFVISYVLYNGGTIVDLLTHGASSVQHATSTGSSIGTLLGSNIFNLIFGQGIGIAGPAALKFGGFMPENFFIQIMMEMGIVGILIFLAFFFLVLKKFFHGSKVLFVVIIALLVNSFFLHIFSDNPAMAVSIFIVMAVAINADIITKNLGYAVPVKN